MDQPLAESLPRQIARDEYRSWAARQPRGRYERVWRSVVRMSPERVDHIRVKMRVWQALDRAVRAAGVACEALGDGATVEIGDHTDYEPDALVNCGAPSPGASVVAPNPVIVVEVASPSTEAVDAGAKLADYFRVRSILHYLIVRIEPCEVIHHFRSGERIEAQIRDSGALVLDPPGLTVLVEEFFRDLPPRTA